MNYNIGVIIKMLLKKTKKKTMYLLQLKLQSFLILFIEISFNNF